MGNAPDLQETIKRFNQGWTAFERALAAARAEDLERYETESRTAFLEVVGALEWAVKYCLEEFYSETRTEKEVKEADKETFEKLLKKLARKARPRFAPEKTQDLHAARRRRNLSTHESALVPYAELRRAFQAIRRFLNDHLPALEEQLSSSTLEPGSEQVSPVRAKGTPLPRPAHRQEGGVKWLKRTFREGLQQLRSGRAQHYDATIASLEFEAQDSLTRHVLRLLETDRRPSDPLQHLSEQTEAEIKELLLRSLDKGLSPQATEQLRRLVPLINRYPALCLEAGWLRQDEEQGLRFQDTHLPTLLVGQHLAHHGAEADQLSQWLGRHRSWAEAAWMAISSGDDLASWACHLLAEKDPLVLLERVVVTCAAFGATPPGTAPSREMAKAYHLCVAALVAFAPRWVEDRAREQLPDWMSWWMTPNRDLDPDSPWFLPMDIWRQCVLDLADASWILGESLVDSSREARPSIPSPLAEVLSSLELPARISSAEASTLTALCAPFLAARDGLLDSVFFKQVFSVKTRIGMLAEEPFLENWIGRHGIRALRETRTLEALRSLAIPGDGHAAGYLLNRAGLIPEWHAAWEQLTSTRPQEAPQGWVAAIRRLASLHDSTPTLRQLLLEECLERLSELGLKSQALQALREASLPEPYEVDAEGELYEAQVALLHLLGLTDAEWKQHIEAWTEKPALAWRTLLAAGAPQAALAWWCVQKLIQREQAPAAYRQGPVGILAHNMEVTSSGTWQLAFEQAQEALNWFLNEGDASALLVLAEACLSKAPNAASFDPPMVKSEANLTMPLSVMLWPKVLHRPAGREAFYSCVERDLPLGEMFFSGKAPFPELDESDLWLQAATALWKPQMLASAQSSPTPLSPDGGAEARRLLGCFEHRMRILWISESVWPGVQEVFKRHGWAPPTAFPYMMQLSEDPWERLWMKPEVQPIILACTAAHGVDVSAPLAALFRRTEASATPPSVGISQILAHALSQLSEYLPKRASELLEQALAPEVLRSMCHDQASPFWEAILQKHGSARVLALLDSLRLVDWGLGVVDAMKKVNTPSLREREFRPELLRPILIRASQGRYVPSERFWEEAWKVARAPEEIPELPQLAAGPWLEELLDKSRNWEPSARQRLLRHLAGFSIHDEVRRRCMVTLLGLE